jgi:hypothetical protein
MARKALVAPWLLDAPDDERTVVLGLGQDGRVPTAVEVPARRSARLNTDLPATDSHGAHVDVAVDTGGDRDRALTLLG